MDAESRLSCLEAAAPRRHPRAAALGASYLNGATPHWVAHLQTAPTASPLSCELAHPPACCTPPPAGWLPSNGRADGLAAVV